MGSNEKRTGIAGNHWRMILMSNENDFNDFNVKENI